MPDIQPHRITSELHSLPKQFLDFCIVILINKRLKYFHTNMTLKEFNALGLFEKIRAIQVGKLIAKRKTKDFHIYLYTLNDFYVEVLYSQFEHELKGFIPFKHMQRLEPYLRQIHLPAFLNNF